jgi:hypothetical protein
MSSSTSYILLYRHNRVSSAHGKISRLSYVSGLLLPVPDGFLFNAVKRFILQEISFLKCFFSLQIGFLLPTRDTSRPRRGFSVSWLGFFRRPYVGLLLLSCWVSCANNCYLLPRWVLVLMTSTSSPTVAGAVYTNGQVSFACNRVS